MKSRKMVEVSLSIPESELLKYQEKDEDLSKSEYILKALQTSEFQVSEDVRKKNGAIYTPSSLAKYVADKVTHYASKKWLNKRPSDDSQNVNIMDPACGDGELLVNMRESLKQVLPTRHLKENARFHGLDIDGNALARAGRRLGQETKVELVRTNALCPFNKPRELGWSGLMSKFSISDGFDIVIANPPWGAEIDSYRDKVHRSNFELMTGQFDTSDLFIELALKVLRKNGFGAFIIPDSLFAQERLSLRKLLAERTTIKFIGRFGEKIFKDVNRACVVVIFENVKPRKNCKVDCFRLCPNNRKLILSGQNSFAEIEKHVAHKVDQARFRENRGYLFNIELPNEHAPLYRKLCSKKSSLSEYLTSSRGIELSKKGTVIRCRNCGLWSPMPSSRNFRCTHCKTTQVREDCAEENIIHKSKSSGRASLIVGQDISRYKTSPNLHIDTSYTGINYKDHTIYQGAKLVVRKTGVGISAAIDYSESLTNQVVYIFKVRPSINFPLEFFLILLCSRLAYFYVTMSTGENEWKSHPYLTQRQILEIPIPNLNAINPELMDRIIQISNKIKSVLRQNLEVSAALDAECERLVMDLYELDPVDYRSVFHALESAQDLLPVKALRNIDIEALT